MIETNDFFQVEPNTIEALPASDDRNPLDLSLPGAEARASEVEMPEPEKASETGVSAVTATGTVTLDGRPVEYALTLKTADVVPPPPPAPALVLFQVSPNVVQPGGSLSLAAGLSAPAPTGGVIIPVSTPFGEAQIAIPAGLTMGAKTVTVPVGQSAGSISLVATYLGKVLPFTVTVQVPTPPPPPPTNRVNVRDWGAKGDGSTDDKLAILTALSKVPAGGSLYFPAGKYLISDWVGIERGNLTVAGDGPASVLYHRDRPGLRFMGPQGGSGALQGIVVEKLGFLGVPGKQSGDGNYGESIQVLGPRGLIVRDCEFTAVGTAVNTPGTTGGWGTQIQRIKVNAWGGVCLFCNGGELIEDCVLVQSDTNSTPTNIKSSHGLYIHSGCTDITVRRCLIQGSWKYGCQLFGKDPNTTIERIIFQDVKFKDCANGFTIQQGSATAAVAKNVLLERCEITGCFLGPALSIKDGDGLTFRDCLLSGRNSQGVVPPGASVGLQLGRWHDNENGAVTRGLRTPGLRIDSFTYAGVEALQNQYGRFEDCVVAATVTNCPQKLAANATPGLVFQLG